MTIVINSVGRVIQRFYDDRTKLTGNNVIKLPDDIELNEDSEYAYIDGSFIEIDYYDEDHKKYFEPDLKDKLKSELVLLKKYLSDTDFITTKYNELVIINEEVSAEEFKDKYSDILDERTYSRKRINEIELSLLEIK